MLRGKEVRGREVKREVNVVSETDGQNGDALLFRLRCTQSPLKMR